MSNLTINPVLAFSATGTSHKSATPYHMSAPTFSRREPAENAVMDARSRPHRPYVEDPYPNEPRLIDSTLVNDRILNESFARKAFIADVERLVNDLVHGKTEKARERIEHMSKVDISDHFEIFGVDPQLFAKLSAVANDTKLTPQAMARAIADILQKSGAASFVINNPVSKTPA